MTKEHPGSFEKPKTAGSHEDGVMPFYRDEMIQRIARAIPHDGVAKPLPGVHLARVSQHNEPAYGVSFPSFCVIAQGTKEIYVGDEGYQYDPFHYLLTTVELPIVIQRIEASPKQPYLGFKLELDPALIASVMLETGLPSPQRPRETGSARAIDVSPLNAPLLEAAVRLMRLVDAPAVEARVMLPLVTREIVFRLLVGEQNTRLRHLAVLGGIPTASPAPLSGCEAIITSRCALSSSPAI